MDKFQNSKHLNSVQMKRFSTNLTQCIITLHFLGKCCTYYKIMLYILHILEAYTLHVKRCDNFDMLYIIIRVGICILYLYPFIHYLN